MEHKVNSNMLILARTSRGFTQTELANRLGITQSNLSKMEQGFNNTIPDKILSDLSNLLKYPREFFFQNIDIFNAFSFHRKRQSLSQKISDKIDGHASIRAFHLKKLLQSIELKTNLIYIDIIKEKESPRDIAKKVRAFWNIPKGPIKNATKIIESAGIIIIEVDFETKQIDGLSLINSETPPIIFINKNLSGDRYIFTLFHELGHIVMHSYPTDTVEEEANEFASEFLMPSEEIKPYLSNLTLQRLIELKKFWKVSMAAILVNASKLNKITDSQYRYLWTQMSRLGYKVKEPIEIFKESPTLLKNIIEAYQTELDYSYEELSQMLLCDLSEFHELYTGIIPTNNVLRYIPGGKKIKLN